MVWHKIFIRTNLLRDGTDATIIACGMQVDVALRAADLAAKEGISERVVDMFTIKPIEKRTSSSILSLRRARL